MSTSFVAEPDQRFRPGVTLHVWRAGAGERPTGAEITSAVVSDSNITFDDLEFGTAYVAGTTVSGPFLSFTTDDAFTGGGLGANTMGVVLYDSAGEEYPPRPGEAASVIFVGPVPPSIGGTGAVEGVDLWVLKAEA